MIIWLLKILNHLNIKQLLGETTDAVNNTNSSAKKHKNSCSIKVFKYKYKYNIWIINQVTNIYDNYYKTWTL